MKILIISSLDKGGAAKAAIRLHEGLLNTGFDSSLLFRKRNKFYPKSYEFNNRKTSFLSKVYKKVFFYLRVKLSPTHVRYAKYKKSRDTRLELFSYPWSDFDITKSKLYQEADIINLHWVTGFLDYKSFFKKNVKPVIWTLHDMNPFTGGEHYSENYLGMSKNGYPLKRKYRIKENKLFEEIIRYKSEALKDVENLHIVALCNWMRNEILNSPIFARFPVSIIPNGINPDTFSPRNRKFSRELLGLPSQKKIVLFVSDSISNNRKGLSYLIQSLNYSEFSDTLICAVGDLGSQVDLNKEVKVLGQINDELLMSVAYSAADVFVIPSLYDNLPNTVIESLMCGTPVVGFPTGGIMDMVIDSQNGIIAEDISVKALTESIEKYFLIEKDIDRNFIREDAIKRYSQKVQSERYLNLFNSIMKNTRKNSSI